MRYWCGLCGSVAVVLTLLGCKTLGLEQSKVPSYLVGSIAESHFSTDLSGYDALSLDKESSTGYSLARGYHVSPVTAVELSAINLGESTLSPEGEIAYLALGVSALAYGFGKDPANSAKLGLAGYLRAGISLLQTESGSEFRTRDNLRYMAGAGLEYSISAQSALRAEIVLLNSDIEYTQLGWLYRFHGRDTIPSPANPSPAKIPNNPESKSTADTPSDSIGQKPVPVLALRYSGNSVELSEASVTRLVALSKSMVADPEQRYVIVSHGDGSQPSSMNSHIVKKRGLLLSRYFVSLGVKLDQLIFQPVTDANTTEKLSIEYDRDLRNAIEISLWN